MVVGRSQWEKRSHLICPQWKEESINPLAVASEKIKQSFKKPWAHLKSTWELWVKARLAQEPVPVGKRAACPSPVSFWRRLYPTGGWCSSLSFMNEPSLPISKGSQAHLPHRGRWRGRLPDKGPGGKFKCAQRWQGILAAPCPYPRSCRTRGQALHSADRWQPTSAETNSEPGEGMAPPCMISSNPQNKPIREVWYHLWFTIEKTRDSERR